MAGVYRKCKWARSFLLLFLVILGITLVLPQSLPSDYAFNNRVIDKNASCDRSFIYFSIAFSNPFLGLIYTDGAFGSQRCTYVNGSASSQIHYNITIPLNECRSQTFPNGSSQNVIVVQRDWRILEASDNLFVITCTAAPPGGAGSGLGTGLNSGSGGGKFTLSFAGITVQGTLASTELVTNSFTDLDYTAEVVFGNGPNGRKLDRPLGVGEQISYVVRLRKLRPGQIDARMGRCWATDGLPSSGSNTNTEIQLSDDDGCTVLPGSNIWNNFQSAPSADGGSDGKILYNDIKAWAFPTSNRVNIFCNLHLCPTVCPPSPCRQKDTEKESGSSSSPSLSISTSPPSTDANSTRRKTKSKRGVGVGEAIEEIEEDEQTEEQQVIARISSSYEIDSDRHLRGVESPLQRDSLLVTARLNESRHDPQYGKLARERESGTVCMTHTNFVIGVSLLLLIITLSFLFIVALLYKLSGEDRSKRRFYTDRIRRFFSIRSLMSFRRDGREVDTVEGPTDIDSESVPSRSMSNRTVR